MIAEKSDPNKELATWEDVIYSNMIQTEALAQIMAEKKMMTKEEHTECATKCTVSLKAASLRDHGE